nr:MAG TPA: hypothetical protein [Caudoviricetes sp.]
MIKSKKNIQKLYIELKASGKQVDKYFKRLNQYYPVPKTIKVLKAILEGVDKINSSTKESNVKLENVVNQYIEVDHECRDECYANLSHAVGLIGKSEYIYNEEKRETFVEKIGNQITQAKELIEYSDSGENVKDILIVIK